MTPILSRITLVTLLIVTAVSPTGCGGGGSTGPQPKSNAAYVLGEDYSFPYEVQPAPYSGYICGNCDNAQAERASMGWRHFEPERGIYDFSALEEIFDKAEDAGRTVTLHISSINVDGSSADIVNEVPGWVFDRYALDPENLPRLVDLFDIAVIPQWRSEIAADFNEMIKALGRSFADDDRLTAVYLHGISISRGEELVLSTNALGNLEQPEWGFSAQVLEDWLTDRMDAYAEAFAGYEYKVAWVGHTRDLNYMGRPDYEQVARDLLQSAWSRGFGNRHGAIERYFNEVDEPAFANDLDDDGYLNIDDTAVVFDGRYFGEENEEYGVDWLDRFGNEGHSDPHRYRMTIMRVLQQRFRWLWTSTIAESLNPPLSDYARLLLGKNADDSPDAWALLFEAPMSDMYTTARSIKNFERFLYQRDHSGGQTVPTDQRFRDYHAGGIWRIYTDLYYEYRARRTDIGSGNIYMHFHVDEAFDAGDDPILKVEVIDDAVAAFRIEYLDAADQARFSLEAVTTAADTVKTFTMALPGAEFDGGLPHGVDFRIENLGPGDITVKWVRLVKSAL